MNLQHRTHPYFRRSESALNLATLEKYGELTQRDIKQLVLDDKWHATIVRRVASEVDSLTLALVGRIQELGERYTDTLAKIEAELTQFDNQVAAHLAAMGIKQGLMQQLLTGRTRLPGFTNPWTLRRLSDMLSYEQPGRFLVKTTKQLKSGRAPVLTAGKTFILGYTNETESVYTAHPVIIFDDFTTASKFVDFDFKAKSSAMKILSARAGTDLKFGRFSQWKHSPRRVRRISRRASSSDESYGVGH